MSAISFTGLGSGLDISGLVSGLVNAQKAPYQSRVNQQQAGITTDISAMGALKGSLQEVYDALDKLNDEDSFRQRKVSGGDKFITITADDSASIGSYGINVDQLAEAHKLLSASTFDSGEMIGAGTLEFGAGESSFTVEVKAFHTLSDIKGMINDDPDNKGVSASIITDASGQYLVLNANETGEDNAISIKATPTDPSDPNNRLGEFDFDPADIANSSLNQLNPAANAQITIDGTVTVTSNTNTFEDAIEGVTITAKDDHGADDKSTMSVAEDNSAARSALKDFVEAYNALIDMSNQLGNAKKGGPLVGDSLLRGVMNSVRRSIGESFTTSDGSQLSLIQIGIDSDEYGKLSFDGAEFDKLAKENSQALEEFFIGADGDGGFANSTSTLINYYTESNGLIDNKIKTYNTQLDRIKDDYEAFNNRMTDLESRLLEQFNRMDALVAQMNSTSSYLQQQLQNMPGVVKEN